MCMHIKPWAMWNKSDRLNVTLIDIKGGLLLKGPVRTC